MGATATCSVKEGVDRSDPEFLLRLLSEAEFLLRLLFRTGLPISSLRRVLDSDIMLFFFMMTYPLSSLGGVTVMGGFSSTKLLLFISELCGGGGQIV